MVEEQVLAGLRNRDKRAFEHFWNRYYRRVLSVCTYILGGGPDAVDVTVDILVDFVEKHAESLESPKAMYSFLRQMAIRRSIRLRDKRDKHTRIERDSQVGSETTTPEEEAALSQLMPLLSRCLENMAPKTQISLRLKYSNKISNEQIGQVVGGSKSYIGRLLSKGKEALRKCIEKKLREAPAISFKGGGAPKALNPIVSLQTIERLLSERPKADDGDCPDIGRMAVAVQNPKDPSHREWATSHLLECEECRQAVVWLQTVDVSVEPTFHESAIKGGPTASLSLMRKAVPFAAAASVLFAVSFAIYTLKETSIPREDDLVPKGGGDSLHVAVLRGASQFSVRPLEHLLTNDKLGLFYSSDKMGYLAVYGRDQEGVLSLLVPTSGSSSMAISPGKKVPLSDGAVLSEGTGCEWLIAVFSDKPLSLAQIEEALALSKAGDDLGKCDLQVNVPGAGSVRVLPVKR